VTRGFLKPALLVLTVALIGGFFLAPTSLQLAASALAGQYQGPPPPPPPGGYPPPPQWDPSYNRHPYPRSGACFFTDRDFRGNRFCMKKGESYPNLPRGYGNNISSIQIFGHSAVRIFNDGSFRNGDTVLNRSVGDLRNVPFRGGHTWNNRISSIIIY